MEEGSHYQPYNDTIHSGCVSNIPFGLYQGPSPADGYLIGRVNQELMSEELKCLCLFFQRLIPLQIQWSRARRKVMFRLDLTEKTEDGVFG